LTWQRRARPPFEAVGPGQTDAAATAPFAWAVRNITTPPPFDAVRASAAKADGLSAEPPHYIVLREGICGNSSAIEYRNRN